MFYKKTVFKMFQQCMATACNLTLSQTFPNQFREKFHKCLLVYLQVIQFIFLKSLYSHQCTHVQIFIKIYSNIIPFFSKFPFCFLMLSGGSKGNKTVKLGPKYFYTTLQHLKIYFEDQLEAITKLFEALRSVKKLGSTFLGYSNSRNLC